MNKKIVVMLDGGHIRAHCKRRDIKYDPDLIEKVGLACKGESEEIFRILYYDCALYEGKTALPVSGTEKEFTSSDHWLHEIAKKDLFAVRTGILKFRGFTLKKNRIPFTPTKPLTDDDFEPVFEQKGVDMRIGLDIAVFADHKQADRIVLITNDTDYVPAMKHARRAGMQVVLMSLPHCKTASELLAHSDYCRPLNLPEIDKPVVRKGKSRSPRAASTLSKPAILVS